jgi:hypothetical protein
MVTLRPEDMLPAIPARVVVHEGDQRIQRVVQRLSVQGNTYRRSSDSVPGRITALVPPVNPGWGGSPSGLASHPLSSMACRSRSAASPPSRSQTPTSCPDPGAISRSASMHRSSDPSHHTR